MFVSFLKPLNVLITLFISVLAGSCAVPGGVQGRSCVQMLTGCRFLQHPWSTICMFLFPLAVFPLLLQRPTQVSKHFQNQPFLFSVTASLVMINPSMRERACNCHNIFLLDWFQLPTLQAGPGSARSPVLAAVESLAVAKNVAEMLRNSNTGPPVCCTAEIVEPAVDEAAGGGEADDGITPVAVRSRPRAVKVSFLWRDALKSDPASKALVDRLRRRMIPAGRGATVPAPGAADGRGRGPLNSSGAGASAAGAGGARPPAAPVVPGVEKPARRKRGGHTTPHDWRATKKSVRFVRSDAVKAQLAAAEELVARAFQDEQHRTVVVQPPTQSARWKPTSFGRTEASCWSPSFHSP